MNFTLQKTSFFPLSSILSFTAVRGRKATATISTLNCFQLFERYTTFTSCCGHPFLWTMHPRQNQNQFVFLQASAWVSICLLYTVHAYTTVYNSSRFICVHLHDILPEVDDPVVDLQGFSRAGLPQCLQHISLSSWTFGFLWKMLSF